MRYLQLFFLSMMASALSAQSTVTFTEHLQQVEAGKGRVILLQDEEITRLVNNTPLKSKTVEQPANHHNATTAKKKATQEKPRAGISTPKTQDTKYSGTRVRHKARGFRIQVYAGTGSSDAKRQAKMMESRVRKAFPELSIYCHFKSPRWICRVGDFATREEAEHYLSLIRKQKISVEASIVPDTVLLVE